MHRRKDSNKLKRMKHLIIYNLELKGGYNALTCTGQLCSNVQLFLIQRESEYI